MSSEHVEVLRGIRDWMASIYLDSRVAALDAAIASLSAPQPPAEAQPVGVESVRRVAENIRANLDSLPSIARVWADDLDQALAQQSAAPVWIGIDWAEGQKPTAVDDLMNAWRAAFVAERATRYREGGMKIEQARIHAETDAARMAVLAAAQQPAASKPRATRADPHFTNTGNSEADFIADDAIACTACGGSGHRDDQQPAVCAHSWHDYGTVPRAWCSRCNAVAVAGHEDRPYGVLSVSDDGKYRTDPIQQPAAVDEAMERAAEEIERYEHTFISTVGASAIIRKHMRAAQHGGEK